MKTQRYLILTVICFLSFKGSAQEKEKILERSKNFSEYLIAGDIEGIMDSYTSDAKIFPSGSNILEGEAVREYWFREPGAENRIIYHQVAPEKLEVLGETAYDYGYYEGKSIQAGDTSSWKGKYVIIWKKEEGIWRMYLDIWNRVNK